MGIAAQRRDTSEPGMKEAAALVAEKLDDTDKEVRYWATWMMMHFKTAARPHVSALLAQLHDSDNHVQEIALFALRALKLEPSTVVPVLWKRFNESTGDTRLRAAIALRAFGDEAEKIQPGLIAMLGSLGEKEFAAGQAELRRAMARP